MIEIEFCGAIKNFLKQFCFEFLACSLSLLE